MVTIIQKFGAKPNKLRKQKGLTQEKLSELEGIDYSYLSYRRN